MSQRPWVEVGARVGCDVYPGMDDQSLELCVALCAQAMRDERILCFEYRDAKRVITHRAVDPIELDGLRLLAWCLHREEVRKFHLQRMFNPTIGPEHHEVLLPLAELMMTPPCV